MTGKELVEFARSKVGKAVYWYGTFGQKCTKDLYKRKCAQYPAEYTTKRAEGYAQDIINGMMCCDCVGLIKWAFWLDEDGNVKYATNGVPDKSAEGMEAWAIAHGAEHGSIGTCPDEDGIILVKRGHTGIYAKGGTAIEAMGFDKDIRETNCSERGWQRWYRFPLVDYDEKVPTASRCPYKEPTKNITRGASGEGVRWIQWMLAATGFERENVDGVDGIFGRGTYRDVMAMQYATNIEVDGIVGIDTRTHLKQLYERMGY